MIKFRAWDKRENTMRDVAVLHFTKGGKVNSIEYWKTPSELKSYHVRNLILMQSTGLKDKNGAEIFEGDIVQSTWYDVDNNPYKKKGEITYVGAQYVIVYDSQFDVETGEITYDAHNLTYAEDAEVIGNIYEQPELLSSGID